MLVHRLLHGMLRCEQGVPPQEGLGQWWTQPYHDEVRAALAEQRVTSGKPTEFHPSEYGTYGVCKAGNGRAEACTVPSDKRESLEGAGLDFSPSVAESVKTKRKRGHDQRRADQHGIAESR